MEFTQSQNQVLSYQGGDLLVSAAAGSGKTAVLIEKLVRLITDPADPVSLDRVLMVTFTRAAASQMKEKLEAALLERAAQYPNLRRQQLLLPLSHIQTNDSFSQFIVRTFISELPDIDPAFSVGSDAEMAVLRQEVLNMVLESFYEEALNHPEDPDSKGFLALSESLGADTEQKGFEDNLLQLYAFLRSFPDYLSWLHEKTELYNPENWPPDPSPETIASWFSPYQDLVSALTYPAMKALYRVMTTYDSALRSEKAHLSRLEISDFHHLALEILQNDRICRVLQERFEVIFIDEYQDSNDMQEAIIEKIARKDASGQTVNVIRVGDIKQSIYRFRLSNPALFLKKQSIYGERPNTSCIFLRDNFRSSKPVVEAVNDIFTSLMKEEYAESSYSENEALHHHRVKEETFFSEARLPSLTVLEFDKAASSLKRIQAESRYIAGQIERLLQEGRNPRDIVILLRNKTHAHIYAEALEKKRIGVYTEGRTNFFQALEIRHLISLLHVIDNPHQDIPLMGALLSPFASFTEDELSHIRLAKPDGDYLEALTTCAETSEKAGRFLSLLSDLRKYAALHSVYDLIWHIYRSTGYYLYETSASGSGLVKANLDLLLEHAAEFEEGYAHGLFFFLRYLDKLEDTQTIVEEAKLLGEDAQVVRIMTIHKSKGLEFPVVFAAGLSSKLVQNSKESILHHHEQGVSLPLFDPKNHVRYISPHEEKLKELYKKESLAEEVRLLYVALTRAEDELYLVGSREKAEIEEGEQPEYVLQPDAFKEAQTFLGWIEPILAAKGRFRKMAYHRISMTDEMEDREGLTEQKEAGSDHAPSSDASFGNASVCAPEIPNEDPDKQEDRRARLRKILLFEHPKAYLQHIPTVLSVSAVKKKYMSAASAEEEPAETVYASFAQREMEALGSSKLSGAEIGTAFHTFMSLCDFETLTEETFPYQVSDLAGKGLLSKEQAEHIRPDWVYGFLSSPICGRMKNAIRVHKEAPFLMEISLLELSQLMAPVDPFEFPRDPDTKIMIQGIMDVYFEEEDGIVLFDYKTDRFLAPKVLDGYRVQLSLYASALEKATSLPVKEKLLFHVPEKKVISC